MPRLLAALLAALVTATGCYGPGDGICAEGFVRNDQGLCRRPADAGPDANLVDGGGDSTPGGDSAMPTDGQVTDGKGGSEAGADAGEGGTDSGNDADANSPECTDPSDCTADAPVCSGDGTCERCVDDASCEPHPGLSVCTTAGACVECADDADCTDPQRPLCGGDSTCKAGCTTDTQCDKDVDDWATPACNVSSGACVECLPGAVEQTYCPDDGTTPGNACDPQALTCSGEPRGTVEPCGLTTASGARRLVRCVADSECDGAARCVAMTFQGAAYGQYCLLPKGGGSCSAPMPSSFDATSVGGIPDTYCAPRQALATCEGVLDFALDCEEDADCGRPGVDDGFCEPSSGRCTFRCSSDTDCEGVFCQSFGGTKYCNPN